MSENRSISKQKIRELMSLAFNSNYEKLLLFGKTRQGKTHLGVCFGKALCQDNISTAFLLVNFMFEEILVGKASGKYLNDVRKLTQTKVLVFNDFGLRNYTHAEATVLIEILEYRHRKGSVIVTSQVDSRGWGEII